MTTSVLVLGGNTTLTVTLSLRTGWDVFSEPNGGTPDAVVVVDDGVRSLQQQVRFEVDPSRVILISTRPRLTDAAACLVPPYPLEDLVSAVEQVVSRSAVPAVGAQSAGFPSPPPLASDDRVAPPDQGLVGGRAATDDLIDLIDRMPALRAPAHVLRLVAEEIVDALGAATVGFWHCDAARQRYPCLSGAGLTAAEEATPLRPDHAVVEEALGSDGIVIEHGLHDPARAAGLPGVRHPVLLLLPARTTPLGTLLVLVGMDALRPEAFDIIEGVVASAGDALALSASLARLAERLGDP